MKKKTVITLLCAGVMAAGVIAGATGFAEGENGENYMVLSTEDVAGTDTPADGEITGVSDVAKVMMPAAVSITNKSVEEVMDIYGMVGF